MRLAGGLCALTAACVILAPSSAHAQSIAAEPIAPVEAPFPESAPPSETQIVLQLVVSASGAVESAVVTARVPADAPDAFATAALDAVKRATFTPSTRDGRAVR